MSTPQANQPPQAPPTVRISGGPTQAEYDQLKAAHDNLKADFELLKTRRDENQSENARLIEKNKILTGETINLRDYIDRMDQGAELSYVLEPISPKNPCSRYDGMIADDIFVWHEAIKFTNDTGYDRTVIYDRAKGCIDRAVGPDSGDRIAEDCSNLPAFNPDSELEVIVRIIKK